MKTKNEYYNFSVIEYREDGSVIKQRIFSVPANSYQSGCENAVTYACRFQYSTKAVLYNNNNELVEILKD